MMNSLFKNKDVDKSVPLKQLRKFNKSNQTVCGWKAL